ncbi:Eukaryotic and archaeal DNA primase, large subunit [uncultured archaeon]|nr:Eukaryotic and archaeal DNA primase, large subunit [uncultured archaeon]
MATATDLTREHYQRAEVREIITKFAMPGDGTWRALNGDFHRWYRYSDNGQARLLNVIEDYEHLTDQFRTLYQSLNVFDSRLWMVARPKDEITPDNPLGTPADTAAYTLGVDIDKGHGYDIEDPETKQAVEAAAQFLVDYLDEHGVHESVWVLFSGGGIYVEVHHEICQPKSPTPEDRAAFFEEITDRYNRLIGHVSEKFFRAHPEHVGKVKYDALNNSKRVFKCTLSIHKKKPYAVTPLNRDAIKIDFERARVPLQEDMIAEARAWYSTYDPAEREPLLRLLDEFRESEVEKKQSKHHFNEIWRSSFRVDQKDFPPCITHIIENANPGEGKTRFTAVLSTFLYQMGWEEEEAWSLVKTISDRNDLGNADHIFDSCFGRISCPSCQKIQDDGA